MSDACTSEKPKFARAAAIAVARELLAVIEPHCARVLVAGSLRRRKQMVGDVELLFVPRTRQVPATLFEESAESLVDPLLAQLIASGVIEKRLNAVGAPTWGPKNKLARHVASGVPVDLFAATEENWWNYVVCRTGSAESNVAIASAARRKGWQWNPYDEGFSRANGLGREVHPVNSEREVFEFVGLEFKEPWDR